MQNEFREIKTQKMIFLYFYRFTNAAE